MFVTLTAYVWFAPRDFSRGWAWGSALCGSLLGFALVFAFMSSRPLYAFFCLLAVMLYSCYLVCDTEAVLGKAETGKLGYDHYILGAVMIYMVSCRQDLIMIMMYLLMILGSVKK